MLAPPVLQRIEQGQPGRINFAAFLCDQGKILIEGERGQRGFRGQAAFAEGLPSKYLHMAQGVRPIACAIAEQQFRITRVGENQRWRSQQFTRRAPHLAQAVLVGIGQESGEDAQVCSYCGMIKPLSEFNANRRSTLGVGRECKECRRAGRRMARSGGHA